MRQQKVTFLAVLFLALCGLISLTWYTAFGEPEVDEVDDATFRQREEELLALRDQLRSAEVKSLKRSKELSRLLFEIERLLRGKALHGGGDTQQACCSPEAPQRLPSIFSHHLPHLLATAEENNGGLQPNVHAGQGRSGVSVVLGVPSARRAVRSYLTDTLGSLISGLSPAERDDCVIVVLVAEDTDRQFVDGVVAELTSLFPAEVASGLLEVVSPPAHFYPDLSVDIKPGFGDSPERLQWRTKQNLDFALLMTYAQPKGTYYVQLEDDVVASPNYVSAMKGFALRQPSEDWTVLEFSSLGFIGKMFKSSDLPLFLEFLLMFRKEKPCDWLLSDFLQAKGDQRGVPFEQSLFQHVGRHSSLPGKLWRI